MAPTPRPSTILNGGSVGVNGGGVAKEWGWGQGGECSETIGDDESFFSFFEG
jgi:hypothetical protein